MKIFIIALSFLFYQEKTINISDLKGLWIYSDREENFTKEDAIGYKEFKDSTIATYLYQCGMELVEIDGGSLFNLDKNQLIIYEPEGKKTYTIEYAEKSKIKLK